MSAPGGWYLRHSWETAISSCGRRATRRHRGRVRTEPAAASEGEGQRVRPGTLNCMGWRQKPSAASAGGEHGTKRRPLGFPLPGRAKHDEWTIKRGAATAAATASDGRDLRFHFLRNEAADRAGAIFSVSAAILFNEFASFWFRLAQWFLVPLR